MFQIHPKKTLQASNRTPNGPFSRTKPKNKQEITTLQSLTFAFHKKSQRKTKSQCLSKHSSAQRKITQVCPRLITTARVSSEKRGQKKGQNAWKVYEQLHTQNQVRHESFVINIQQTEQSAQVKWKKRSSRKITQGEFIQRKQVWDQKLIPYQWQYVSDHYSHYLSKVEASEIKEYNKIYYVGHKVVKQKILDFDSEDKTYNYVKHDHIAYRYQILCPLGKGAYGQVFKVLDHKTKEHVAIKIVKNDSKCAKQAFLQIKILSHIKDVDCDQQSNAVRVKDFTVFRKHVCIIFQLLSDNLYELIVRNNFNGLGEQVIRRLAIQILVCLEFLRKQRIIHCDLKPQNILLRQQNKSGIKIIDFGSSCFQNQIFYTYIQSRYYRAPQISLALPYDNGIDVWSTGCILAELYLGIPLFAGENELQQMKYMIATLGQPSWMLLNRANRKSIFFDQQDTIKAQVFQCESEQMFCRPLIERIKDKDFFSFIEGFLRWDSQDRISPSEALQHHWIKKGVPELLRNKLTISSKALKKQSLKGSSQKGGKQGKKMISYKKSQQQIKKTYLSKP